MPRWHLKLRGAWMARVRSMQAAPDQDHRRFDASSSTDRRALAEVPNLLRPQMSRLSFRLERAQVRGPRPQTSALNSFHYTRPISATSFGNPCGQRRKSTASPQARAHITYAAGLIAERLHAATYESRTASQAIVPIIQIT